MEYAMRGKRGVRSIRSALKIADERMYHKKNEMKGICGNER